MGALKRAMIIFSFFFIPLTLFANLIVQGEWDYYYKIRQEHFREFRNKSNTQEIVKKLDNGEVIVRNRAICRPIINNIPYPFKLEGEGREFLECDYSKPADREFLLKTATAIIGDADTLNGVLEKIYVWIRNNVFYSLGTPSDAIGVIKGKRAYCEGYANAAVQLLRILGIPARVLTCYIPPGCGWGAGGGGGYHAFLEFFIPGEGWYPMDPQSSFGFVDPYHIIGYPHGAPAVTEMNESSSLICKAYKTEPSAWPTFTAIDVRETRAVAFHSRVIEADASRFFDFRQWSITGGNTDIILSHSGKYYDARGLSAGIQSEYFSAVPNRKNEHLSFVLLEPSKLLGTGEKKLTAVLKTWSGLAVRKIDYLGARDYYLEADFYADPGVKRIQLLDENDQVISGEIKCGIGGKAYSLHPDAKGFLYFLIDENEVEITGKNFKYNVKWEPDRRLLRIPEKKTKADAAARYLAGKPSADFSAGGAVLCGLYDWTGTLSSAAFDKVYVFSEDLKITALSPEKPGFVYCDGFNRIGREYILMFVHKNYIIKKKLVFERFELIRLEIRLNDEKFIALAPDPYCKLPKGTYYEFVDKNNVIPLVACGDRLFISYPDGRYYFSAGVNNPDFALLDVRKNETRELSFRPGELSEEDLVGLRREIYKDRILVYGRIAIVPQEFSKYELGRLRERINMHNDQDFVQEMYKNKKDDWNFVLNENISDEQLRRLEGILLSINSIAYKGKAVVCLWDSRTRQVRKYLTDKRGYFFIDSCEKDNRYILYYLEKGLLTAKSFTINDEGFLNLDLGISPERTLLTGKYGARYYRQDKHSYYWAIPGFNKDQLEVTYINITLENGELLFCGDRKLYFFTMEKRVNSFVTVDMSKGAPACSLDKQEADAEDPAAVARIYRSIFPAQYRLCVVKIRGMNGAYIKSKKITAICGAQRTIIDFDNRGIGLIERLDPAIDCLIRNYERGFGFEYNFNPGETAADFLDIDLAKLPRLTFSIKNYDGSLYRATPYVADQKLLFGDEKLYYDDKTGFVLCTNSPNPYFKLGKKMVLTALNLSGGAQVLDYKNCALDPNALWDHYRSILGRLTAAKTGLIFRLTNNGQSVINLAAKIMDKALINYKIGVEGFGYLIEPANDVLVLDFCGPGYIVRRSIRLEKNMLNELVIDLATDTELTLVLTGNANRIGNRPVNLFVELRTDKNGQVTGYKEKISTTSDAQGLCRISLAPGEYYLEAVGGFFQKITISNGDKKTVTVKVPG